MDEYDMVYEGSMELDALSDLVYCGDHSVLRVYLREIPLLFNQKELENILLCPSILKLARKLPSLFLGY